MAYTLMERIDLMTASTRQSYLALSLDNTKIDTRTFYKMTAAVTARFGRRDFKYTWIVIGADHLVLFISGNATQLDYIHNYLSRRMNCHILLQTNRVASFRAYTAKYYAIPSALDSGMQVGGTHFVRVAA